MPPLIGARRKNQKVYRNRMSQPDRVEVANLYQAGVLIKGVKTIGFFLSLIYADTKKECASICSKCGQIFSISASVRSTLYSHSNTHKIIVDDNNIQIPAHFKVMLTEQLANMVSCDIVPFSVVENAGFREVLDMILKAGFDLGKSAANNKIPDTVMPSIMEYIPSRKTVKKYVDDFVTKWSPLFDAYIFKNIKQYGAAMTMDFGTKVSHYYACTIHFFTSSWKLLSWTFCFTEYDRDSTDADELRKNFFSILEHHDINLDICRRNVIITTDRGSNLIAALYDFKRVDDLCHQLNILSKRIISPYKARYIADQFQLSQEVKDSLTKIDKCLKALTKIIKAIHARPDLRKKLKVLGKSVKRHVETRWLSRYQSILSYINMNDAQKELVRDELYDFKFNGKRIYRETLDIIQENAEVYQSYVDLLEPVQEAVIDLQAQNYPTINKALILYQNIRETFEEYTQSADILTRHMATSALQVLNYQQTITSTNSEFHLLGLLLDPLNKDQFERCSNQIDFPEAIGIFRRKVKAINREPVENDPYELAPPSPFSVHISNVAGETSQDLVDVEINKYLSLPSEALKVLYQHATDFWRAEEKNYPTIAKLARKVLCITSSASSEGLFNLLVRNVTTVRSSIKPTTVSSLITMKNLTRFKKYYPEEAQDNDDDEEQTDETAQNQDNMEEEEEEEQEEEEEEDEN